MEFRSKECKFYVSFFIFKISGLGNLGFEESQEVLCSIEIKQQLSSVTIIRGKLIFAVLYIL